MMNEHDNHNDDAPKKYGFLQRQAMRMARWPKTHFWVAFVISFALSFIGFAFGDFSVSNEGGGWDSRGTLIANRQTQLMMVTEHTDILFSGDEAAWEDLITNVQPGWQEEDDEDDRRRRLIETSPLASMIQTNALAKKSQSFQRQLPFGTSNNVVASFLARRLQEDESGVLDGCDNEWYTDGRMANDTRLWPVWQVKIETETALEPAILEELCMAEEVTQTVLEEKGLCFGCEGSDTRSCLPPHSIVLYTRMIVPNGLAMDCATLAQSWAPYQAETEFKWKSCVEYIEANPEGSPEDFAPYCDEYFYPSMLDEFFDTNGYVEYTSSIFATLSDSDSIDALYELTDQFDKAGERIEGAYDTQDEDFVGLLAEGAIGTDMLLATGSALVTTIAMMVHTKSLFLTVVGLVQIILSFPMAYFVYHFLGGFVFFPFLNFIGVFVVFALGADHVFVAVDKWKNARNDNPTASTEEVAAKALPDAASAMFLTTSTTAIAFFGTAICPVAPVRLFAIFCGLLIVFDYVMDVVLMFPCLCIYDGFRQKPNCCITCQRSKSDDDDTPEELQLEESGSQEGEAKPIRTSLIRRILLGYYNILHKIRWPLLAASTVAFAVCCYFASTLGLPLSSDVRVLQSSVEYEQNYEWRLNLLSSALDKQSGSQAYTIWGVVPADTGDHSNPESWSTLELDDSFDPSTEAAQTYLRNFCPRFFVEEFAAGSASDCAINRFENWLLEQYLSDNESDAIYQMHCAGASALPMPSDSFHACLSAWSQQMEEKTVLSRSGIVEILYFSFRSRVRGDSPNGDLDNEWNLIEKWVQADQKETAPEEVSRFYFSSYDFWWYDTNTEMFVTAYGSAAIALTAAAVIIFISSRSLVMTLFSVLSIGYVLASVTSMMVAAGWSLGFLESICFSILIGVSVDFVIHFSHAYVALEGDVSREHRTKHALIDMGPSILAAAFTTLAGAMVMLFCVITFFTKFAFVLFFTIIQATIGSFVVFLTLTDCVGPSEPTKVFDQLVAKCTGSSNNRSTSVNAKSSNTEEDPDMNETTRTATPY